MKWSRFRVARAFPTQNQGSTTRDFASGRTLSQIIQTSPCFSENTTTSEIGQTKLLLSIAMDDHVFEQLDRLQAGAGMPQQPSHENGVFEYVRHSPYHGVHAFFCRTEPGFEAY